MALEKEIETYKRELVSLHPDQDGKFLLIHEDDAVAWFDTYADALKAGYEKFGLAPFMVQQVSALEPVHQFTRDIVACPTSA